MSGMGSSEILLILLIAAVVIGPENTRSIIRSIVKGIRVLRKSMDEFRNYIDVSEESDNMKQEINDVIDKLSIKDELEGIKTEVSDLKKDMQNHLTILKKK